MVRILVSNTALPSQKIGSWTNRITRLIESHPGFFDYILSPSEKKGRGSIQCRKRKWLPFIPNKWRSWETLNYRAVEFVRAFKKLDIHSNPVQVVVIDDMLLLEAFALLKNRGYSFELVFSFHGHSFVFPGALGNRVDKVLFLTGEGYRDTFARNGEFTPLAYIVGNGVDSGLFFPLSPEDKAVRKKELGIDPGDKVLLWMSNNRRKKGIHLFEKLADRLCERYPDLQVVIIGLSQSSETKSARRHYFGKIPNQELPRFLQAGDFYAFTSLCKEGFGLSLVEAAKCGNQVLASEVGGVQEVISGLPGSVLVGQANVLESWESAFGEIWESSRFFVPNPSFLASYHSWDRWENLYIKSLQD